MAYLMIVCQALSSFVIGTARKFFSFIFLQSPGGGGGGAPPSPGVGLGGMLCVPPIWPLENFMGVRPFFCGCRSSAIGSASVL